MKAKKTKALPTALDAARTQVKTWSDEAKAAFPERDAVIDSLVLCAVARTNVILYGPPGTAKSLLARSFADAINGNVFDLLFTRYTAPNEFMGPTDVQALKLGRMKRVTAGYAPEADVFFIDEGFKANSACLNAMLTLVNEHKFHDDGQVVDCPLRTAILASNEFPEDNEQMSAFDDRFPMRFDVKPLQNPDNFRSMLRGDLPSITALIDVANLDLLQEHAESIDIADDAIDALWTLRDKLDEKGIYVSDRKFGVATDLLRARASIIGADRVTSAHIGILEHILWLRPDQKNSVRELVRDRVATWIRDLRSAIDVIDEQEAAMAQAIKGKGNISATTTAIGRSGQKLKELDKDVLGDLDSVDEAKSDVARLRSRVNAILKRGRDAMQNLI